MKPADSSIFQCLKANPCEGCQDLDAYKPFETDGKSCIGNCMADLIPWGEEMGFPVFAHHLPPCLVWRYTGDSDVSLVSR